jgi:hypothetical protein
MILYHGSNIAIEEINLEKSRPCKDFGRGFYLSEDEEQAKQMAIFKALTLGGEPIVTKFNFNEDVMTSAGLNIRIFKDYSKEWADFVFLNRENDIPTEFDIVYGPIANDKVGLQIRKFKDGSIDKTEFLNRLKYMKGITFQYYFGTEEAIRHLIKI